MINIEQIESLIACHQFQQLKYFQEKNNVFTIVGQTHTEHWHSSFISWLLDPNSSLRLGHYPLVRLLSLYMIKNENADFSLKKVFDIKLDQIHFETEKGFKTKNGKNRSIDVYGESDEIAIVIENKVKARENMNGTDVGQTKDYRDYAEENRKEGQKIVCLFITPDPKQKPYDDSYTQITYQELYDYVIAKCIEHPQVSKDGKYLLEQYANNLREPVHNQPMALVNIPLCNEIYDLHTEVLDEIFNDVEKSSNFIDSENLSCVVYSHYKSIFDEIYLSLEKKHYGRNPKSNIHRGNVSFTDLYNAGKIKDGTRFTLQYGGEIYHAIAEYDEKERQCYMLLLDENEEPFYNEEGKKMGYYQFASQAGKDIINAYRKKRGIESKVESLNGPSYWKTEDGITIKSLIDSL